MKRALKYDIKDNDLYLDAIIQRFEFTYELLWKLCKKVLKYIYDRDCYSPKSCFKGLKAMGLINDYDFWLQLIEYRNLIAHTYDFGQVVEVYEFIKENIDHLERLLTKLEQVLT